MTCGNTIFSITSGSGPSAITVNVTDSACSGGVTIKRERRPSSIDRFEAASGAVYQTSIFSKYRWTISGSGIAPSGLSALPHPGVWSLTAPHPDTGASTTVAVASCEVGPGRARYPHSYSFSLELDET